VQANGLVVEVRVRLDLRGRWQLEVHAIFVGSVHIGASATFFSMSRNTTLAMGIREAARSAPT
jgi:hypothetical protein